ncbi:ABC transporter ATP-binding protein, partial [Candidatus Altiarchaeota archaeon]
MKSNTSINIKGLWKRYGISFMPYAKHAINCVRTGSPGKLFAHAHDDSPYALRDVNLEVHKGEMFGIIGPNGAGKSTLLKVLAGVTPVTKGTIEVCGRPFPMIELNAGIHRELTGRENVRLLGAIMGLSRREIEDKIGDMEKFCELGRWFDRPVRMYSSGMLARLGFTVA